jgi:hypothetical protein
MAHRTFFEARCDETRQKRIWLATHEVALTRFWRGKGGELLRSVLEMRGDLDGGEVNVDRIGYVLRMAARHHDRDRQTGRAAEIQDQRVARAQSFLRQRESAEAIVAIRIGSGKIDREFGLRCRQRMTFAPLQCIKVVGVTGAIRQFDVEIAGLFAKRKIPGAVNRKGEHRRIICQDRGGAVALMHIAIQDCHAPDSILRLHRIASAAIALSLNTQ